MITGETQKIREDRIRRKLQYGTRYTDSVSPVRRGLIHKYQELTADEEGILARAKISPEDKLKANLVSSLVSLPPILEMANHALHGVTDNIVDMVEKKKERIEANNDQIDRLRARGRLTDRLADHKRHNEHWNRIQAGYSPAPNEWQRIGELGEKVDEGLGAIHESEIRGRALRLSQEVKETIRYGGDPNSIAPPVPGSQAKFEDTRTLETLHRHLSDQSVGSAIEIASTAVYGKLGQSGAQVIKYGADKGVQWVGQEINVKDGINEEVALNRSRDIQDRSYYRAPTGQNMAGLAEAMSSMGEGKADNSGVSSAQPTSSNGAPLTLPAPRRDGEPDVAP